MFEEFRGGEGLLTAEHVAHGITLEHYIISSGLKVLIDGSRLMPDGTVWKPGGAKMHLKKGEMIMMDGHVMTGSKAKAMQK